MAGKFMEMNVNDKEPDYYDRLEDAKEFEQYWCEIIEYKLNLKLTRTLTKENQARFLGDTLQGFEFKYDHLIDKWGNLWIETQQKTHYTQESFMPSSLTKRDNTWMFCMGDYQRLYFLPKRSLLCELRSGKYEVRKNKRGEEEYKATSIGFKLPLERAKKVSVLDLYPIEEEPEHTKIIINQ